MLHVWIISLHERWKMTTFKREMAMDQADGRGIFIHKGRDKVRCAFSAEFFAESLEGEANMGHML